MQPENRNPGWRAGASGMSAGERRFHVQNATAEPLLQRLDGVMKSGNGWRARCPSCGGSSRKVAIAEREGKVLLHCFGGCQSIDVLNAVGLSWADVMPPRHWPESPEERRRARQAIRETGWASALETLAMEAAITAIAANKMLRGEALDWDDYCRLAKAEQRIGNAREALVEVRR